MVDEDELIAALFGAFFEPGKYNPPYCPHPDKSKTPNIMINRFFLTPTPTPTLTLTLTLTHSL